MQRVIKLGSFEIWLAAKSALPDVKSYDIAPPEATLRLRRHLLRRISRRLRDMFQRQSR